MNIIPYNRPGHAKSCNITDITVDEIKEILGEDNCSKIDAGSSVRYSWGFLADGTHCGLWDYKGSWEYGRFSFYGPRDIAEKLFGKERVS
jgi:hypothetical protein